MNVIIFSRVSGPTQDTARQIAELQSHATKQGWAVKKTFTETISGAKKNADRPVLLSMMEFVLNNRIDKVLCWELSRLGRNTVQTLTTIEQLTEQKVSVYIHNHSMETLSPDGSVNTLARFLLTIMAEFAHMERTQIRQRMASGYNNFRKNGGRVGRKHGSKEADLETHRDIVKLLKQDLSVRHIMKITGKASGTVQKVRKLLSPEVDRSRT